MLKVTTLSCTLDGVLVTMFRGGDKVQVTANRTKKVKGGKTKSIEVFDEQLGIEEAPAFYGVFVTKFLNAVHGAGFWGPSERAMFEHVLNLLRWR